MKKNHKFAMKKSIYQINYTEIKIFGSLRIVVEKEENSKDLNTNRQKDTKNMLNPKNIGIATIHFIERFTFQVIKKLEKHVL